MKFNITGNIDVGQNLPVYIEEKFNKEATKFFDNIPYADVYFKKDNAQIRTTIVINDVVKKGVKITAEADDFDVHRSFDEAFKKLISQLRKEKDKLVKKKKKGDA